MHVITFVTVSCSTTYFENSPDKVRKDPVLAAEKRFSGVRDLRAGLGNGKRGAGGKFSRKSKRSH